ncbi:endoribonuclease L-PSP [Pararhizobium polonicum]|jgi:enamine deaminase RidA (YjgF/YER057c/UK114 family)|uniref:Endoribonuclease L-PSP n=1 Tax=Pararhizobium polonicum TaxID=1612624 RepID=A0A1C7NZY3_9HYPH|nr:RidA family protein [Pararhizobium polonicum]OBZ94500.1 endoribonuclease L-PSP [Pararhizobium polonicum]
MKTINPAGLKQQTYYNHVKVRPGTPIFPTGQVSWDENGDVIGEGDIDAQVAQTYKNIGLLLTGLGATPDDIVKTVTYVTDPAFAPAIHRGRLAFFDGVELPASTFIHVAGLADPKLLLEIDLVVMVPA